MHSRTIDVVTDWETVATPAGYEGLRRLADREFSGAVSAGPAWAFLLNGRIVGIFEGGIEDFEDADATAYRAADPSLPLLFAMQERDGETRANYYTNETPLRDVDQTLSSGGFTGYVELSENVLSGDYYVVYHGGKSMSAAFVGSSERLITGEEAFETAADEVGIYEVVDVDIELVDIPEPAVDDDGPDGDDVPAAGAASEVGGADAADEAEPERRVEPAVDDEPGASDPAPEPALDPEPEPGAGSEPRVEAGGPPADAGSTERGTDPDADVDPGSDADGEPDPDADVDSGVDPGSEREVDAEAERDAAAEGTTAPVAEDESPPTSPTTPDADGDTATAPGGTDSGSNSDSRSTDGEPGDSEGSGGALTDEERWQRARTIPSLDPEESGGEDGNESEDDARERTARMQRQRQRRRAARDRTHQDASRRAAGAPQSEGDAQGGADVEALKQRLSRARGRIESLEDERDSLLSEREELIEERDSLRNERAERTERIEELEAERERLRSEVDRLQSRLDDDGGESASESMSPDRALSGTNLFVRYDSKGRATLKHAQAGDASRSDVRENLRLEHHTTFETEGVAVDGRPYEEFLRDTTEHAFARWVIGDLLYEIGETGNRSSLAGLFDAIPDIDRVEVRGEVGVETDDGVEQRSFDVVFRDRMGDPLFVADINSSRDATTEAMVGSLVENTHTVASEAETLAAGFYVTESFFEPGALETVGDRTGGGILSRSSKRSFVKLSRKRGYHLCLVEARNGEFHLNVPEL
ncbi:DUF7527 domain-containing protein [Halobellus ruber]|uniref:DUF7527 domain-containing protein n=1 Tax=Halobellus ruber TaxID=2761102 RepID=A0A7J9SLR0_9EURY|nr:hypothetical protein [Halobellus ruber]MBB6645961.1 hypothetical protein [Halobellus ruber]